MTKTLQEAAPNYHILFQQTDTQSQILIQEKDNPSNAMSLAVDLTDPAIKALFDLVRQAGLDGLHQDIDKITEAALLRLTHRHWLALSLLDETAYSQINQLALSDQQVLLASCMVNEDVKKPQNEFLFYPKLLHHPKHAVIKEKNGEGMSFLPDYHFVSWDGGVSNHNRMVLMPKSIVGLQNIIRYCRKENLRVRASGYRHTASNFYAEDDAVCVAMVDLDTATHIPTKYQPLDKGSDLQGIQLVGEPYIKDGKRKIQCKIGAATCHYHFQDWVHDPQGDNREWMIPFNVIMTEITFGGSNAPICHGAGVKNQTVSDLVTAIEFVNPKGELQKVTDKELIKTAAGAFGLLGLTTSITLELDEMQYANLKTVRREPILTAVPQVNQQDTQPFANFVKQAEQSHYAEWFWFPLQSEVWVDCWQANGDKAAAQRYPGSVQEKLDQLENYAAYLTSGFNALCPKLASLQTKLLCKLGLKMMLNNADIVCTVEDALHFRHGLQNIPSKAMEFEIPIPHKANSDEPDYTVAQKAWWATIDTTNNEKYKTACPLRTAVEMRIMGGSNVTIAPQKGNDRTCALEVITARNVPETIWIPYCQDILDKWAMLTDEQGKYLNIRSHWAKHFDHLMINRPINWLEQVSPEVRAELVSYVRGDKVSVPYVDYCKIVAFRDELVVFKKNLTEICQAGGYELKDIYQTFSNPLLDQLLSFPARPKLEQIRHHVHKNPIKKIFEKLKDTCFSSNTI